MTATKQQGKPPVVSLLSSSFWVLRIVWVEEVKGLRENAHCIFVFGVNLRNKSNFKYEEINRPGASKGHQASDDDGSFWRQASRKHAMIRNRLKDVET